MIKNGAYHPLNMREDSRTKHPDINMDDNEYNKYLPLLYTADSSKYLSDEDWDVPEYVTIRNCSLEEDGRSSETGQELIIEISDDDIQDHGSPARQPKDDDGLSSSSEDLVIDESEPDINTNSSSPNCHRPQNSTQSTPHKAPVKPQRAKRSNSNKASAKLPKEPNKPKNLLKCNVCSYETYDESYYFVHQKIHRTSKFSCDTCRYVCGSETKLKYHQRKAHMKLEDLLYYCGDCTFTTSAKSKLQRHCTDNHRKGAPTHVFTRLGCVKCLYISKEPPKISPLLRCPACKKPFLHGAHYQEHLLSHIYTKTEEGDFECTLCKFVTSSRYAIVAHDRNVHQSEDRKCVCT